MPLPVLVYTPVRESVMKNTIYVGPDKVSFEFGRSNAMIGSMLGWNPMSRGTALIAIALEQGARVIVRAMSKSKGEVEEHEFVPIFPIIINGKTRMTPTGERIVQRKDFALASIRPDAV